MNRTDADVPGQEAAAAPPPPMRFCLPRASRLLSAQYRAVFDAGRSLAGRYVVVWARDNEGTARRVGVVTSRRALRTAVERNRARRLMREAFRLNRHALRGGVDLVLVARSRIARVGAREVADDFLGVCRKAGLWRKGQEPC